MIAKVLISGRDEFMQLAGKGSAWIGEMPQYAKRTELRTAGTVTTIYKGWADYGSAESASVWMIVKITLDEVSGLDVVEGIAGGEVNLFTFTWDGRVGHTYT